MNLVRRERERKRANRVGLRATSSSLPKWLDCICRCYPSLHSSLDVVCRSILIPTFVIGLRTLACFRFVKLICSGTPAAAEKSTLPMHLALGEPHLCQCLCFSNGSAKLVSSRLQSDNELATNCNGQEGASAKGGSCDCFELPLRRQRLSRRLPVATATSGLSRATWTAWQDSLGKLTEAVARLWGSH